MKAKQINFFTILALPVVLCLFNCYGKNTSHEADPSGLVYSSAQGGAGTSSSLGALTLNIRSDPYWSNYKKYTIDIDGLGDYTIPVNTIQFNIPDINPGTYTFQINIICNNGNNANCSQYFINGKVTVAASYTSVIDSWL